MAETWETVRGSELRVGDTVKVWWLPNRDTITGLTPYDGPLKGHFPHGASLCAFALNKSGMTIELGGAFERLTVERVPVETPDIESGLYRHFKGGFYKVIGMARSSEDWDGPREVIYHALETPRALIRRPASMWNELVPNVAPLRNMVPRFAPVGEQTYVCPACGRKHEGWLSPGHSFICVCGKGEIQGGLGTAMKG